MGLFNLVLSIFSFIEGVFHDNTTNNGKRIRVLTFSIFCIFGFYQGYITNKLDTLHVIIRDDSDRARYGTILSEEEAMTTPSNGSADISPYYRLKQMEMQL